MKQKIRNYLVCLISGQMKTKPMDFFSYIRFDFTFVFQFLQHYLLILFINLHIHLLCQEILVKQIPQTYFVSWLQIHSQEPKQILGN